MIPRSPEALIRKGAEGLEIRLPDEEIQLFLIYLEALTRWNRSINLTGHHSSSAIVEHHFLDSLMGIRFLCPPYNQAMADIGTGAGFPGIPIKLHYPEIRLTLMESSRKKAAFLLYLQSLLKLQAVTIINKRVEALHGLPQFQEKYDVIVTRAFAKPPLALQMANPFLAANGQLILYVSPSGATALGSPKGWIIRRLDYRLPFSGTERTLLALHRSR